MIRKDILPDVWNDSWKTNATQQTISVGQGSCSIDGNPFDCNGYAPAIVLCNPADAPMFMLHENSDSHCLILPDIENLHIDIAEDSQLCLYRLQGMNTPDRHITQLDISMQTGSSLSMCTLTLGGGHVRNNVVVRMKGQHCTLQADGLYLVDRQQQCDNYIFVEHAQPHCTSRELYKGIVDDAARARFNGHVLVQDGAVKTEAYQTNRNILLTDKAHVDTRPFLEIYNDDVKCSHGSTIGQLDSDALFYLMTRGISQRTAVTLLSYAFCDEVIRNIELPHLREAVSDMVKKRLHGEITPCIDCALQCSSPCNGPDANFHIDPDKL